MARRSIKAEINVCASKRRFSSEDSALAEGKSGLKAYRCMTCNGFHLTSRGSSFTQDRGQSPGEKPIFEPSILARATGGVRRKSEGAKTRLKAECMGRPKPSGHVRLRVGTELFMSSEPVQPAHLRHLVQPGMIVEIEACLDPKSFYCRVILAD